MTKYRLDKKLFLPHATDNTYRGLKTARFVFYGFAALAVAAGVLNLCYPEGSGSGQLGLLQVLAGAFLWVAAFRYRSLIPLLYTFCAAWCAARIAFFPQPAWIYFILLPLAAVMVFSFHDVQGKAFSRIQDEVKTWRRMCVKYFRF